MWFIQEIRVIHIVRIWVVMYSLLENNRKDCNISLLSPSLVDPMGYTPRCCFAVSHSISSGECDDAIQ